MNNANRLGCLTGAGFTAALIALLILFGAAFVSGSQMFSPGKLNAQPGRTIGGVRSHADIADCKTCHTAPWERAVMADRCLECHTNIASQMRDIAQLHGIIVQKFPNSACRDCHQDHRGATASLTDLGGNAFPHEALGFSLNKHRQMRNGDPISCEDCHAGDVATFASDSCQACHSDLDISFAQAHLLLFGSDCAACHDGADRFSDFDHNAHTFKLEGGHANVDCAGCHLNARSVADLQSAPQDCYSCHSQEDEHDGGYGSECGICHNPSAWEDATFDHNLSAFKLEGRHAEVVCEKCHVNNVYKGTPKDCYSCHRQDDEHNGQYETQCEVCHTPSGWQDASFDHERFAASNECAACHAEPREHAGQFGADCAVCHSTNAWEPASYNGPHTFPMDHEGAGGKCQTCHPNSLTAYTCYGCHEHNESKIASKHREEGIFNYQSCIECHSAGRKHEGGEGGGDDD